MSVSIHGYSEQSVNSKYNVEVVNLSSDEESHVNVPPKEECNGTKGLDVAGPSGAKKTCLESNSFDPKANAYYIKITKSVTPSNKRTSDCNGGWNKKRTLLDNKVPVVTLSSDEFSG